MTKFNFTKNQGFSAIATFIADPSKDSVVFGEGDKAVKVTKEDVLDFIAHERELLAKKSNKGNSELTDTQKENIAIGETFIAWMASRPDGTTVADLRKHFGYSSQKVSPIMASLEKSGKVVSQMNKRVKVYKVA